MSLEAYKERQDRAFDTFRSQYRLDSPVLVQRHQRSQSSISRANDLRVSSNPALDEAVLADVDDNDTLSPQLSFAPQMRRLEVAPWEDDNNTVKAPSKTKKSRASILKKFKRVASGSKSPAPPLVDKENLPTRKSSPEPSLKQSKVKQKDSKVFLSVKRSEVPLGRPLEVDSLQDFEDSIIFKPVDPNVLYLQQTVSVIAEDDSVSSMKPSRSTPQIHYEIGGNTVHDRMSRMFDNLKFE